MSLSVGEKLSVVRALDALGVHFIEAGFPELATRRRRSCSSCWPSCELETATICRLRHDPAPRLARPRTTRRWRTLVASFAPVVCLVGKSWVLHLEKVIRVSREENLAMIADSIGFCRGQGKRPVFDAEHFFDGYRDDPGYALECVRAAAEAGAENVTLCDTNGGSLPGYVADDHRAPWPPSSATRSSSASTPTTTPSARSPTRWPRSKRARAWSRAASTATASAAATPTSSRSCRRCS